MQGVDVEELGITFITKEFACSYDFQTKDKRNKPWLAKITGICTKFGFKREFVNTEWKRSEKYPHLQGMYWRLETGTIYEYRNFMVDHLTNFTTDGYFVVRYDGIYDLEKEEIRTALNMPNKKPINIDETGWGKVDEFVEDHIKRFAKDDIPF